MAKKKNNLLIYGLIALVLILAAVAAYQAKNKEKGEKVQTEVSELRTIRETVEASGKVFPKTEVKISSDVSGELVELYVNEGDSVTVGQILARVDPEAYNSQVERARAGVNSAKAAAANSKAQIETFKAQKEQIEAQLANARDIHKRNEKLHKEKVISDQEYETSLSNVNSLEANLRAAEANIRSAVESAKGAVFQIKSAEATLKEISTSLKRTTIYSTMDGIVSKLNVEKGERVVGTSMMAGTEILRVADLRRMEVQVEVTENDLPRLSLGQLVDIEIDAYINRKFKGTVVEIAHTANNAVGDMGNGIVVLTSDQVTNFVVTIDIDPASYQDLISPEKPYPFRPGMSASVQIYTNTKEGIVTVPIQAVGTRDREKDKKKGKAKQVSNAGFDDEIKEIVFVVNADTVEMREVKTGIQDDDYIEIISGLKEGVEVVTGPYAAVSRKLDGGDDVIVKNDEEEENGN
ncbi:MAG TPA: HlyD family efflux transporter periplasmic adaptor subunit [Bacteroidetes bacterium]|nr:HlyD family efflux transporter periplasmic adaptor subunit [Bacteroidota bacterium]